MSAAVDYRPAACVACGSTQAHCDLDHDYVAPEFGYITIPAPPQSKPAKSYLLARALDALDQMSVEDTAELFGAVAERLGAG